MNFMEIALTRQSCRSFDPTREIEEEKLNAVLEATRLAPSACNGQPYHLTVCRGRKAKEAAALKEKEAKIKAREKAKLEALREKSKNK